MASLRVLTVLLLSSHTATAIEIWQAGGSGVGWRSSGTLSSLVVDDDGTLRPAGVDPARSALAGVKSRGGEIRSPQSRDDLTNILTDGDLESLWEVTPERADGTSMEIDLAAILPINRIRIVGDEEIFLRGYELFVHDGNPARLRNDRPIAFENRAHANPEQDAPVIDIEIPLQFVRFIKVISTSPQEFKIAEVEIFGDGFAPSGQFESEVIELAGAANFGRIELLTQADSLAAVVLQTRTGTKPDPLIYFYKTEVLIGEERSELPLVPIGDPEAREAWEDLAVKDKGHKEENIQDWSAWSAPYEDFSGLFISPGNRQYLQFRLIFSSDDVNATAAVESFSVEWEPNLAQSIVGEIDPGSVTLGEVRSYNYYVLPEILPGDAGFDRIEVETPFLPIVTGVTVDGADASFEKQEAADRFSILLTGDRIASGQLLRITFEALATVYGTTFFGTVFDTESAELGQEVTPGNATGIASSDRLSVEGRLANRLVSDLSVSKVFTPNGDGANDTGKIDFILLRALIPVPLQLTVLDLSGRTVRRLRDEGFVNGPHVVSWDGLDDGGRLVPPGLYVLKLNVDTDTGSQHETRILGVAY
jgi:hypothetical protein